MGASESLEGGSANSRSQKHVRISLTALLESLMLVVCGSYLETNSGVPIALSKAPLPSEPDPGHVVPLSSVERACFLSP